MSISDKADIGSQPTHAATKSTQLTEGHQPQPAPAGTVAGAPHPTKRRWWLWFVGVLVLAGALVAGVPWLIKAITTVSTDDAYVSGHVTFVAPRVAGQVVRVLVDDNNRVKKGDLLVQLDKEPFEVQVNIARAAVTEAESDLVAARAQARATVSQMRSLRFNLENAIEDVDKQIAVLRSRVATLNSQKASLTKAQADYERARQLVGTAAVTKEEFDQRHEAMLVAEAKVEEALQGIYQVRVALGLPAKPEKGDDLTQVPPDLDQTFSSVKQAQASLLQAAAQIGLVDSFNKSPKQMVADFYKRDPQGDIDRIYEKLLKDAPVIKQAEAKLVQAQRNLDQALLNLRYCDIFAEIDGVITRRNVNPGNNVVVGQNLMAIRSLTDIWIDANFKETQLAKLRIGQPVDLDVDMYGSRQQFKGRISGFTMGTGSTLALLPAENATGNFVKVVQRLPVRIEVLDYDPEKVPLFIGLSVTPYVRVNETPTGPGAGSLLQPTMPTPPPTQSSETGK
jgi:membrane fusion protein (multidrug efflux system)